MITFIKSLLLLSLLMGFIYESTHCFISSEQALFIIKH